MRRPATLPALRWLEYDAARDWLPAHDQAELQRLEHLDALHAFLAPLAEPSKVDSFKFTREWLREEASRVTDMRTTNISRQFNVPPSYVLIHRVSTAGIGVLCQLECEGEFRAEVLRWIPGYFDPAPEPPGALEGSR